MWHYIQKKRAISLLWYSVVALALGPWLLTIFHVQAFAESGLLIYYLDVGQGDSAIITCDDEILMIDGGDSGQSQFIYSFLRNTLDVDHIDVMIATHPHADHVGGLAAALNACSVDVLYASEIDYDTDTWQSVLQYANEQGTQIIIPVAGDEFSIGEAHVEILGPLWYHNDLNDMSLIVKITYSGSSFLFVGDAEWEAEKDLLDAGMDLSADVLKVGHHGSGTSTSDPFLQAVSPTYAVISVGANNNYGHPDEDILAKLEDAEINVMRTDQLGTIKCLCDEDGIFFSFEHPR